MHFLQAKRRLTSPSTQKTKKKRKNKKEPEKPTACKLAKQRPEKRGGPLLNPPNQAKRPKTSEPTQS